MVEEEDLPPIPEYTDEQMTKLMMFIQHITTAYDLTEDDIGISFMENVTNWLLNVTETILFVYFDCGFLCASPQVPASPVNSLTYFIREEPCFVFSVSSFLKFCFLFLNIHPFCRLKIFMMKFASEQFMKMLKKLF